jgi:hypothetical protein
MSAVSHEIISPNAPDLPSKDEIAKLCPKNGIKNDHLTHTHNGKKIFIKYGTVSMQEARNQQFFYDQIAKRPDSAIRIPEIYHAFNFRSHTYIVMEHIDIDHVASDEQRARAITELVTIEPPLNATPGPIGGGHIKHGFFDTSESDVVYASIGDLEKHINRVCLLYPFLKRLLLLPKLM